MTLALAATTLAALYAAACWLSPFPRCRRCHGTGHQPHPILRNRLRPCRRCKGSGRRLRIGRRTFNYFAAIHHDATTHRPARATIPTGRIR